MITCRMLTSFIKSSGCSAIATVGAIALIIIIVHAVSIIVLLYMIVFIYELQIITINKSMQDWGPMLTSCKSPNVNDD